MSSSPPKSHANAASKAKMLLVGAGPGDPDLLTLKALRALDQADLVLADRLVSKEIRDLVHCELRIANKVCGRADPAQQELDRWGLEALAQGKRVVRLKNGDPFVLGRGGEEAQIYSSAGFDVEVIPGISSALSAPASAGIPVTMRGIADQVLVCTGHGKHGTFPRLPEFVDHRTTVFLMAMNRLEALCHTLIHDRGFPANIPAAIVHAATTGDAVTVRSTLGRISAVARRRGLAPPGTLVVGNVVTALQDLQHYAPVRDAVMEDPTEDCPEDATSLQWGAVKDDHAMVKTRFGALSGFAWGLLLVLVLCIPLVVALRSFGALNMHALLLM